VDKALNIFDLRKESKKTYEIRDDKSDLLELLSEQREEIKKRPK
jgi:hypothetical protein